MFGFLLLCIAIHSTVAQKEDIPLFTKEDFISNLDKRNNFVMFFAPWCSHCKRFSPVWSDLAKEFNSDENSELTIAKVDCTLQTELCSDQDITGYPTLKIYKIGQHEGTKFKGIRDLFTLKKFIKDEVGSVGQALDSDGDLPIDQLIELTDETFEQHVSVGNHFVKFYAPWCSHCQRLAPTWQELASEFSENKDITISKVDCTKNRQVCSTFEVMSYPSLLWIQDGKKIGTYDGARSLPDLVEYVSQMLQPKDSTKFDNEDVKDAVEIGKSVIALNDENFHFHVDSGFTFVKFFAPWCGHCKRLAPTWEELAKKLSDEVKVKIAHVDCTLEENKELCNDQEVEGYPTLFFYRNGAKVSEYNGSRVLEDLVEFVKRHTSSHDEL